jgi:membrane protein DedA with SNARE-associated domain
VAAHLVQKQLRKKRPKLVILVIAIAVALLIIFEVIEISVFDNSELPNDFLVTSIIAITRNVTTIMASFGYIGIFLLMLLDSVSFPIPSEMILPFAGFLVYKGNLDFFAVVIVATIACIAGSLISYYIGMKGAHILIERRIIGRVLISENQLSIVVGWFNRYGSIMVAVSRMIPIFRTLISFPAGAVRMPLKKFIIYTTLGSLAWNVLLIYVGYFLGTKWQQVVGVLNNLVYIVIAASAVAFAIYLLYRKRRIAKSKKALTIKDSQPTVQ